jgi:uncharacterized protein with NRDE domain
VCLVVFAWQQHPDYPLIVAGNRDEFHARPTREAHWWPDQPDIVGGRDLQAAGTWLALHRNGRFATVTNYRDAVPPSPKMRSRGHLVTDYLQGSDDPLAYSNSIDDTAYAGFNMLLGDGKTLAWYSNRSNGESARILDAGVYALSNALLDSPWHKVLRSKAGLQDLLDRNKVNETELLRLLDDRSKAPSSEIDSDRLPFEKAHAISAPFIVLPDYGTRSSSIVLGKADGSWRFHERRFSPDGRTSGDSAFTF